VFLDQLYHTLRKPTVNKNLFTPPFGHHLTQLWAARGCVVFTHPEHANCYNVQAALSYTTVLIDYGHMDMAIAVITLTPLRLFIRQFTA
jgi:hypothetical protein